MPPSEDTVNDLRTRIGSPPTSRIPDDTLISYLEEALRKFNRYRPREALADVDLVAGTTFYDLPSGVSRVRRVYGAAAAVAPVTQPGPSYPEVADDWVEALDIAQQRSRDRVLYGGDVYIEAGQLVVTPPPSAAGTITIVYPTGWTWDEVEDPANGIYDDVLLWGEHRGFVSVAALFSGSGGVKSITRMGQQTTFADPLDARSSADNAMAEWKVRVERALVGPSSG